MQKAWTGRTSVVGATYARFAFGLPFAALFVWALFQTTGHPLPQTNTPFLVYGAVGGVAQILATLCLVGGFQLGNFAVATTYSKTETIQTAIVGVVLLGESLSPIAIFAIVVSLAGVLLMSVAKADSPLSDLLGSLTKTPALMGLASGALFGVSAVCYRGASLSLEGGDYFDRATFTVLCVIAFQATIMTIYLILRERQELRKVIQEWRGLALIGLLGMAGSVLWFTAMTLQNAAYVRAVGQIELVFTFVASVFFFHEKINRLEAIGVILVIGGVLLLVIE
jgi:drug/metabolite transporter (DMT)-like permease